MRQMIRSTVPFLATMICLLALATATQADTVSAEGGDIEIVPINHGSLRLEYNDINYYVDPFSRGDYSSAPKADVILVTDIHGDHLDPEMIDKLRKDTTVLVVPEAARGQAEAKLEIVIKNGETQTVNGMEVEAVAMYNHERGPEPGKLYHDKGRGNGYILTLGGKRLYFSGDTACTDEMKALTEIDVAFVSMNLPYTMPPEEAADCVRAFKPKIVYPYHYRGSDLSVFSSALEGTPEVEIRLREWYP